MRRLRQRRKTSHFSENLNNCRADFQCAVVGRFLFTITLRQKPK